MKMWVLRMCPAIRDLVTITCHCVEQYVNWTQDFLSGDHCPDKRPTGMMRVYCQTQSIRRYAQSKR